MSHVVLSTYVPAELAERVRRQAVVEDRKPSVVIRRALEAHFAPLDEENPGRDARVLEGNSRDDGAQLSGPRL